MQPAPNASGAVAALVLGILGLIFCPLCAPVAWALGQSAEREVDASGGAVGGRGLATAGKVTGIIGTVLLVVYVVVFVAFFVVIGESIDRSVELEGVPR